MQLTKTTYYEEIHTHSIDFIKCTMEYLLPDGTHQIRYYTFYDLVYYAGCDVWTVGSQYSYSEFLNNKNFNVGNGILIPRHRVLSITKTKAGTSEVDYIYHYRKTSFLGIFKWTDLMKVEKVKNVL